MAFQIEFISSAKRDLKKLPINAIKKILDALDKLATNPRPHGYKQLTDFDIPNLKLHPIYRIRVGDYRILYVIQDNIITITVVKIAHRREVYE